MKYYVVDVFTDKAFRGNPAGVCILDAWLSDETLQNVAAENNLSETAFLVKQDGYYDLRWFTPEIEIDLCGHATMGSGYILFKYYEHNKETLHFKTMSGMLSVSKKDGLLWLDFPSRKASVVEQYSIFDKAFGVKNQQVLKAADLLVVFDSEETIKNIEPDFEVLKQIKQQANMPDDSFGVIITAKGTDCDFVSRFFAPNAGISEDPVTGRAYCTLIPYWSEVIGKKTLFARQLSKRGGTVYCEDCGGRVKIGGHVVLYLEGEIRD